MLSLGNSSLQMLNENWLFFIRLNHIWYYLVTWSKQNGIISGKTTFFSISSFLPLFPLLFLFLSLVFFSSLLFKTYGLCFNYWSTVHGCWLGKVLEVVYNKQNLISTPETIIGKEKDWIYSQDYNTSKNMD